MSLDGPHTHARPNTPEDRILKDLRSGGFGIRYSPDDAVHRILAPTHQGNTCVGLILIRNHAITYAEFDRTVLPWWGRGVLTTEYAESLDRLATLVREGRRK